MVGNVYHYAFTIRVGDTSNAKLLLERSLAVLALDDSWSDMR